MLAFHEMLFIIRTKIDYIYQIVAIAGLKIIESREREIQKDTQTIALTLLKARLG